jgi:uncharacterized protein (TIGR02147 family)
MKEQAAVQHLLQSRYEALRQKNPQYSIRAFAKKVGLNSGAVSSIFNGKRNVSITLARRLAERLMLDPQERSELFALFPEKRRYKRDATDSLDPNYLQLSVAQYRVVAESQHFALMTLMTTKNFKSDPTWIAKRLRISVPKTEQAIARLISIGILEKDAEGNLTRIPEKFRTTDDVADLSIRKSHEETLDLAKESLHRETVAQRDFTHTSIAIDPKNLSMAKELIRKFQDDFTQLVETGNKTEVYRLSMQFFPLTDLEVKEEN